VVVCWQDLRVHGQLAQLATAEYSTTLSILTRDALDIRPWLAGYPAGYRKLKIAGYPAKLKK
jgi:hypothetical protein